MGLKTLNDTPPWEWPEDAGATLLSVLRDHRAAAADRLLAARLAGDFVVIDDEIAAELLAIVHSSTEPEALRARAATALGPVLEYVSEEGLDDEDPVIAEPTFQRIQESFDALFHDAEVPKQVRRRILEASVRAPRPWHAEAVRDAYASDDGDWALTAVFCMQYVRGFEHQILEALESESAEVRCEAVCAAGAWSVEAAAPSIAPLLALETSKPLLLAAIEAAAFVCPDVTSRLLPLLDSRDEDVVEAVHEALAMVEALEAAGDEGEEEEEEDDEGVWH